MSADGLTRDGLVLDGSRSQLHSDRDTDAAVTIRRVCTLAEYDECVLIERETWGDQFTEQASATILRIAQEVGGVTAAAFAPTGRMLGFVFGLTGVRSGELAHWSDMLAVRPEAQHTGIGTQLKHYQRALLSEIGVRTMFWTYDPLVARNAHLNLVRLGARVAEYRVNYYGQNTGSVIHAGLGTDRFIVTWDISGTDSGSNPTAAPQFPPSVDPEVVVVNAANPSSGVPTITDFPDDPVVRVAVPDDIFAVLAENPIVARAWRDTTRRSFSHYLSRGYAVATFVRSTADRFGCYYIARSDLNHIKVQ